MKPSLRWIVLLALALLTLAWFTRLDASVPTIAGKDNVKQQWRLTGSISSSPASLAAVPAGRELVLTDLTLRNFDGTAVDVILTETSTFNAVTIPLRLAANGHFAHAFVTGPVVRAGETIKMVAISGSPSVGYYVAGYLRKAK